MGAHASTVAQGSTLSHFARNGNFGPGGAELLVVERGEGAYVFDTQGNRYVDGSSSLFCAQIGYSYGEEMARPRPGSCSSSPTARTGARRTRRRSSSPSVSPALAPGGIDRVFFTRGGSEAVEAAWKLARQYHVANGEPQRRRRSPATSPTTASRSARSRSPGCRATRSRSARRRSTRATSPTPTRFRSDVAGEELTAQAARRRSRRSSRGGPGDGRGDHRRAGPERRRLPGRRRPATGAGCASSPTDTGSCCTPTR